MPPRCSLPLVSESVAYKWVTRWPVSGTKLLEAFHLARWLFPCLSFYSFSKHRLTRVTAANWIASWEQCRHQIAPHINRIGRNCTYTHRIWPHIWLFPCQKYRIYTVYIYTHVTVTYRNTNPSISSVPFTTCCYIGNQSLGRLTAHCEVFGSNPGARSFRHNRPEVLSRTIM
jgi:hypothetical protein